MFTTNATTGRFSAATALAVLSMLGSGLAAGQAAAQTQADVPSSRPAPTTTPTRTPAPAATPTPTRTPAIPATTVDTIAQPEDDTPDPPAPPTPKGPTGLLGEAPISIPTLLSSIQNEVTKNGGPVGWAYDVKQNGVTVGGKSGGFARKAGDGNNLPQNLPFTGATRVQLMSVTKPITAMAIMRALDEANVSVDTPITPFLPASWAKGKGFSWTSTNPVTFRHLLTHTSGILQAVKDPNNDITGWGNTWDGVALIVKNGVTPNVADGEQYKNANYALLRVLLPELWAMAGGPKGVTEENHGFRWLQYVNSKLLVPAGISEASCWAENDFADTRLYSRTDLSIAGRNTSYAPENRKECGGHVGLHLSARDLTQLTYKLRESSALMPADVRDAMFADNLGWKMRSNTSGTESAGVWWHGGDGFYGSGREVHTCVMNAPQHLQLSLVMNSAPGGASPCRTLLDAVNAAR